MGENLRVGVIGLGILGSEHARFLHEQPGVKVEAVADIRADVAESVGAGVGAESYSNFQDMLRAHHLDVLAVATPDPMHRAPTVAALEAGVPYIIQEKPFATTIEDAEAIYEAVEARGAKLFVNYANRAAPLDIATRYVIQEGLIGDVVYGESRLDDNISVPTKMWGERSRAWAAGSSTAHFLLSHVVDLLLWYFRAEVKEVYAISQNKVLGYSPDLYDAYLIFGNGLKVRVKAEWIKHIDGLVEFYMCFSGSEGTIIYNKRAGFGAEPGWRANLRADLGPEELRTHQDALYQRGANLKALLHRPAPTTGSLSAGGGDLLPALQFDGLGYGPLLGLIGHCLNAIREDTLEPESWRGNGPLPSHVDGLRQTQVVTAIVRSAETGQPVEIG